MIIVGGSGAHGLKTFLYFSSQTLTRLGLKMKFSLENIYSKRQSDCSNQHNTQLWFVSSPTTSWSFREVTTLLHRDGIRHKLYPDGIFGHEFRPTHHRKLYTFLSKEQCNCEENIGCTCIFPQFHPIYMCTH